MHAPIPTAQKHPPVGSNDSASRNVRTLRPSLGLSEVGNGLISPPARQGLKHRLPACRDVLSRFWTPCRTTNQLHEGYQNGKNALPGPSSAIDLVVSVSAVFSGITPRWALMLGGQHMVPADASGLTGPAPIC